MNNVKEDKKTATISMEEKDGVYQTKKVFFLKAWWQKYLNRLNKVTDGKPQCCK